ncbi:hypothetical protein D3C78_1156710 [compost metagenome]
MLEHQAREDCHHNAEHIQREDRQRALLAEKGRSKYGKDGQARPARHKRCHHDGHQTFARRIQRTCAHHRRHVTAKADNQRNEGFTRQTERLHQTIHYERRAGHVTRILKEREEQIHHANLRYQRKNGIHPAANPLRQENSQPFREVQRVAHPLQTVNKDSHGPHIKQRL